MKRYLGYIRVSTPKQGVQGSSLQEQKSAIQAYASRSSLSIVAWYEERETAATQGRQRFMLMMKELERGRAQGVVIHKIDRSARNLKDWANLGDLIDRGVDVRFAHDDLDLTSRGGRLSADIQAVIAADFIRNLREEVRKGFYGRLKQGLYPLRAPIGYLDTGRGRAKAPDPLHAPLVRQAFTLYASGEFNFEGLQAELHRRGLRGRDGGLVSKNGLTTMLNNPLYMGLIHIRKSNELFQGIHEPLITKALYDRVQAVLRGERAGTPYKHDFLFRRMIRCSQCGYHLIGERQKARYIYYRCHSTGCAPVCVKEGVVDASLRQLFSLLTFDPVDLRDLRDKIAAINSNSADERKVQEASLRLRIGKCDERLDRLTDALLDGALERDEFNHRKTALLHERRGLQDQLAGIPELPSMPERLAKYLELANMAYLSYENGISEEKRDIVISLTSNLTASGKTPTIALRSPFQQLVDWRISHCCELGRDRPRTQVENIIDILKHTAEKECSADEAERRSETPTIR
jgi:DNA invertase Pin-like site-specific DNA recombinase